MVYLRARPGYGIWCRKDEAGHLNVLILKAERPDIESGAAQALGYIGEYFVIFVMW
jgi:hypothetical protein